jgi:hypothetical protein
MKYLKWIYPGLYRRWHVRAPELKVDDDRAIYNLSQKDDKCCFRLNIDCILDNAAIIRVSPSLCKLFNKERLLETKEGICSTLYYWSRYICCRKNVHHQVITSPPIQVFIIFPEHVARSLLAPVVNKYGVLQPPALIPPCSSPLMMNKLSSRVKCNNSVSDVFGWMFVLWGCLSVLKYFYDAPEYAIIKTEKSI